MKKLLAIFFVLAAGTGSYLFWMYSPTSKTPQELKPVSIRMAWLHQAQFAGIYTAKEKGFYALEGLDADIKEFDFASDQGSDLSSGNVQFSMMSSQELISYIDRGDEIEAIAVIYQVSPYAFASLKSAKIETPADLKGKSLGLAGGNQQAAVTYKALMNEYGVSEKEVTFKDLGFDTTQDVITGQADIVDLYRTDQTYLLDKAGTEYNLLYPEQFGFGIYGDTLVTTKSLAKEDPELVKKFVRATLQGWKYALDNQEEALTFVAKYENELYKDPMYEKYILGQSAKLIRPTGSEDIGAMSYVKWKKTADAMRNARVIKTDFAIDSIYSTDFLPE